MEAQRTQWPGALLWVTVVGAISSIWCITAASRLGPTFDEPYFCRAGLQSWRAHTTKPLIDTGAAPLPMLVDTLPLVLWERWTGRALDPDVDHQVILRVGRCGTLVFWWLLLLYAYLAAYQIAGAWAARLAVVLLAVEPAFLAHAALATADIPVTACLLGFWFHFRAGRNQAWRWRVGLPGLLYGLALFAKMTALPYGMLGIAVIEFEAVLGTDDNARSLATIFRAAWRGMTNPRFLRDAAQVFWIGLLFLFLLCGSDWKPSPSFVQWAESLPDGLAGASMRWLAGHLAIFSNAGNALGYQIRHNIRGHSTYLFGECWPRAVWYYFPAILTIKLTLSLLALPLLLAVLAWRSLWNWPCGLALLLLFFSLNCRVQTGVRFMLPLVSLAAIGLAAALVGEIGACATGWRRRTLLAAGCVAPLWAAWSAAAAWPHGLCYANELWGGTAAAYRLASDSNYDWGQGVPELTRWAKRHGPVDVYYFGTDPAVRQPPLRQLPPVPPSGDFYLFLANRYVAIGTSVLYSTLRLDPQLGPVIARLRDVAPIARTTTFLIFRAEDLASARPRQAAAGRSLPAPSDAAAAGVRHGLKDAHAAKLLVAPFQQ